MTPLQLLWWADGSPPMPEYRPLAEAAERYAGTPVRWVDGTLADVPDPGGFVWLRWSTQPRRCGPSSPERAAEMRSRLVPSASTPTQALQALAHTPTAAVLDRRSLRSWTPSQGFARGPAGLRTVAGMLGATCAEPYVEARHCLLESRRHDGLPHLLVDYLRTYEGLEPPTRGVLR